MAFWEMMLYPPITPLGELLKEIKEDNCDQWAQGNGTQYLMSEALDCQDGGVVFPDRDHGSQTPRPSSVVGRRFWRVPVYIPQAENAKDFACQMKAETERLRQVVPVCGLLG